MEPRPAPAPLPTTNPSVVLKDLNGTLPPEARAQAESAGRRFVTFFEVPLEAPLEIPLGYFPEPEAYRDHLARVGRSGDSVLGYYSRRKGEIVVGSVSDFLPVLLHEMSHFVLDQVFDEVPLWLNEGLAEYFERSAPAPDGLVVMDDPAHRRHLAQWIARGRQPDLRELLATNDSTWEDHDTQHANLVRALSWSVVDFLMRTPRGKETLRAFMARLKDHRGLNSLEAIARTFPGGEAAFERHWLEHVEARATPD